jgi:hypothetical protein
MWKLTWKLHERFLGLGVCVWLFIAQTGFELAVLMFHLPECWDCSYGLCLALWYLLFLQYWCLKSGSCACWASILLLELHLKPFYALIIFQIGSQVFALTILELDSFVWASWVAEVRGKHYHSKILVEVRVEVSYKLFAQTLLEPPSSPSLSPNYLRL